MTTHVNPPGYDNEPVILVHLVVEPSDGVGPPYAWCAPFPYVPKDYPNGIVPHKNIPRVFCPACARANRTITHDNT